MLEQVRIKVSDNSAGAMNDRLRLQIYKSMCRPGQAKSISVYLLTAVLLIIFGCVCCWENEKHLNRLQKVVADHEANKKKALQI